MSDPATAMKQLEALDARYLRLRSSHAALLAAAKMLLEKNDRFRRDALQAIITKAEEHTP